MTTTARALPLARPARQAQHEDQDFGDRLIEFGRDLLAEFDIGERARQHLVFLDRNVVSPGDLDDLLAKGALSLGDNAWRAGAIIMQRNCELALLGLAHDARSRKCPATA